MNATIDLRRAEAILRAAIADVKSGNHRPSSPHASRIGSVILGTHLTYRYILLNGLLAKATNAACNPICLQAGAGLDGAFDARSLCHKVLVPVERDALGARLGGSNEPFLNKPARFTTLSTENAVRRGRDTLMLHATMASLGHDYDAKTALAALKDAIFFALKRPSRDVKDVLSKGVSENLGISLIEFAEAFIEHSVEGETCALLAGAAYSALDMGMKEQHKVVVHPVNQAGSSSNEVSDVDVHCEGRLVHTAEVKDKEFSSQDVEHAVGKVADAGHRRLVFLVGPRGHLNGSTMRALEQHWEARGFVLVFVDLLDFFKSAIALCPGLHFKHLAEFIEAHAKRARVKDETISIARRCLRAASEKMSQGEPRGA